MSLPDQLLIFIQFVFTEKEFIIPIFYVYEVPVFYPLQIRINTLYIYILVVTYRNFHYVCGIIRSHYYYYYYYYYLYYFYFLETRKLKMYVEKELFRKQYLNSIY